MKRKQRRTDAAKARRERNAADPNRKRENMPEIQLPERLYRAYGASAAWKNFKGEPMPMWGTLPPHIKRHWQAVSIEAQNFAREAMVQTIKGLVKTHVGDAPADAVAGAGNEPGEPLVKVVELIEVPKT